MGSGSSDENVVKSSNEKAMVSSNEIGEKNGSTSPPPTQQQQTAEGNMIRGDAATEILHRKRFSSLAIVGLAFAILNSPTAASASLSVVIVSGGPVAAIWGMLISATGVLCIAASMAELTSILPTPGGPYHWAYRLSPPSFQVGLAYFTGWLAAAGWVCLTATTSSLAGSLIVGIIALLHPNYEEKAWHEFLIYIVFAIGAWAVNVFAVKALDGINKAALIWSLAGVALIMITTLACASPQYQTGKFVFATYINRTGWNDGVAYILGLLQSTFALVGTDGATHIIDEMPRPHIYAPAAMIIAPIIGSLSAFIILIVFLFVLKDFDAVATSSAGPLLEIIYQAVGNKGGAIALYMFPVCSMAFAAISILCASSRQTQAFARDYGLPFAHFFSKESRTFGVPIPAITLTSFWVIVFGCIYLGSTSAFNAIISSSVVMLQWTYCIPIILLMVRGRSLLDTIATEEEENAVREQNDIIQGTVVEPGTQTILHVKRHYNMGKWGYLVNAYGVAFNIVTSIFFLFPPELPATGSTVNYAAAVVAFVILLAALSWIFDGRKKYSGPRDLVHALARARNAREE
jgi:choline transport protein